MSILPASWEEKYLAQIADGRIKYPRIDSEYGPMVPYSDEVHHLCYEIWAFQSGRNAQQTERILHMLLQERPGLYEDLELNSPTELKVTTIRGWAKKENWEGRANMEMASILPQIRRIAYRELGLSVLPAIQALREIAEDRVKEHAAANAVRTKAAQILLDRAGYGPRFDIDVPKTSIKEMTPEDLKNMTTEELMQLEAGHIDQQAME